MATILIIDDDEAVRGSMRRILERAGHRVLEAGDGREGVDLFREAGADVVVTDLIMPEQEGIETIMELREDFPDARIVAVSGGGRVGPEGPLGDAEALGADATLPKPFTVEGFLATVEGVLGA